MNLYKYYAEPEALNSYRYRNLIVPGLAYWWLKHRFHDIDQKTKNVCERSIARQSVVSLRYARHVLVGPFPLGEDIIATDACDSYMYAKEVLKGPFSKGESIISTDAYYSVMYARDVIKGRFPDGEFIISTVPSHQNFYEHLLNPDPDEYICEICPA